MKNNILLDVLPETVKVDGKDYLINTDFRTCIVLELMISDNTLTAQDRIIGMLDLFYGDKVPKNIEGAIKAILEFYRCGEPERRIEKAHKNGNVTLKSKAIYSYEFDAPYIYSAFLSQYNIDLNDIEYLHWWKFQALFKSLDSHNKIVEIMSYRATDLSKIENKQERSRIAHLKQIYNLPDNLTVEDKVAMAGSAFGGGLG